MSDSEPFDKEAEKEKLREQLRREEENRRSTQHMSELLLKGATMTNRHCDTCGDPLFRYEGQVFCPTCSQEGTQSTQPAGAGAEAGSGVRAGGGGGEQDATDATVEATPDAAGGDRADSGTGIEVVGSRSPESGGGTGTGGGRSGAAEDGQPGAPADVEAARAALARKLTTLARQAEETADVGRSRELLAAAREAAEALAAVDSLGG